MKKLLFLTVLCAPILCFAQDWKSVRENDTTYYDAGDLKVIWIDSSKSLAVDSVFYFYPSVRANPKDTCLNIKSGPTWLGKLFYRNSRGIETYFNYWDDSIKLNTKANLNSSWLMHRSGIGNEFVATVTNMDTMTIDNNLDSIKEITLAVFDNNNAPLNTHYYNGKKMVLSKNHGFIQCLEWYIFPDDVPCLSPQVFRNNHAIHKRLPKNFNEQEIGIDIRHNIRFIKTGNARLYRDEAHHSVNTPFRKTYLYDSIIFAQVLSPTQMYIQSYKARVDHFPQYNNPPNYVMTYSRWDTTYSYYLNYSFPNIYTRVKDSIFPEVAYRPANYSYFNNVPHINYPHYRVDTPPNSCFNYKLIIELSTGSQYIDTSMPCRLSLGSLSGGKSERFEYLLPHERSSHRYNETDLVNPTTYSYSPFVLQYLKMDGCSYGEYIKILALSSSDITKVSKVDIYPNPAKNRIYFKMSENIRVLNAELFSLQGKRLSVCKNCNELNTANVADGFYILSIKTDQGIFREKIIIQH